MSQTAILLTIYILYLIYLIGFFIFSAFGLYHLEEYGYVGDFCRPMTYIYVGITALIMLLTLVVLILLS